MADSPDFKFVFFNVGQGDATLISNLNTLESILVDVKEAPAIIEELSLEGCSIKTIIISHWDEDHWKGLPSLLEKLLNASQGEMTDEFVLYANYRMNGKDSTPKSLERILQLGLQEGLFAIKPMYLENNNEISLIDTVVEVLWPSYDEFFIKSGNNFTSIVINLKIKNQSILLLPGDATGKCWDKIETGKLKADIFKYPHHGGNVSETLSARELIEKINPKKVIVSYGKNNRYGHPSEDYKKAKKELSDRVEFLDTSEKSVVIYYDSKKENCYLS